MKKVIIGISLTINSVYCKVFSFLENKLHYLNILKTIVIEFLLESILNHNTEVATKVSKIKGQS